MSFCGITAADGQRPKDENGDDQNRGDQDRQGIVARGILEVLHMHRLHFHAGEIEEDSGGQDHIVEVAEIREESGVQRHLDGLAHGDIDNAQDDQDRPRE